jgi:IS30 family transposase
MLGSEDFIVIQALVQRGVYLCDIAQQLGVHPKTVRRALERGGPPRRRGGRRGSMLDPELPRLLRQRDPEPHHPELRRLIRHAGNARGGSWPRWR